MENDAQKKNTYALNPESPEEMARLINLDRMSTRAMGGVFAGLSEQDIAGLNDILDLACGPGGWVLDAAFERPEANITGVDISKIMIDYAKARARTQKRFNTSFHVMSINDALKFADASFDLVNARALVAAIPGGRWEPLIAECLRILRPGGILRLTEPVDMGVTNSPAYERTVSLSLQACQRAGYGFSVDGRSFGLTHILPGLMRTAGFQHMQHRGCVIEFSSGLEAWMDFYRNSEIGLYLGKAFLVKMGLISQEEADALYQQTMLEMNFETFRGMLHSVTCWGYKP